MLHAGEARHPLPALGVVAEAVDHPGRHVVDGEIGGGAGAAGGELLEDERRIEAGEAGAAHVLPHIDAAHAERGGSAQLLDGEVLLLVPLHGIGRDLLIGEIARHVPDGDLVLGEREHVGGAFVRAIQCPPRYAPDGPADARAAPP